MTVKIIGKMDNTKDHTFEIANRVYDINELSPTITNVGGGGNLQPKIIAKCVGGLSNKKWGGQQFHQQDRVYYGEVALALPAQIPNGSYNYLVKEGEEMKIKNNTKQGYLECPAGGCFDGQFPDSKDRRGRVQEGGNVTPTLTAEGSQGIYYNVDDWRIRKLTPKECYRLMGYKDTDFDKAQNVNSNTQLYKQAGNAIVKQVLMAIFLQMGLQNKKKWNDMTAEEKQEMIAKSIL